MRKLDLMQSRMFRLGARSTLVGSVVAIVIGLTLNVGACSDDDGGGKSLGPVAVPFTVTGIGLKGVTAAAAVVKVEQQDDADGAEDTAWEVDYVLDGGARATSLPMDDGSARTLSFVIKSTPSGGGTVERKRVTISLHK